MAENNAARSDGRDRLRIAMVAPPWFRIPPSGYGGIEWICFWLVEGLVSRGHDVTLFAADENKTSARFVQTYEEAPSTRVGEPFPEVIHAASIAETLRELEPDVTHDNTIAGPLLAFGRSSPTVVTAHGPVDGEIGHYYGLLGSNVSLVSISDAQRRMAPELPWIGTVYNAIPIEEYPFREDKEDFAVFLGRMNPEKAPHLAIDAAREAGLPIVLAGKCSEQAERHYFESEVEPRLGRGVEWVGQADTELKKDLLSRARCFLFPIRWEEPFGIVMVEAMACATPVVGLNAGSVPEVVVHGETGFICEDPAELPQAVHNVESLEAKACREHVASHFTVDTMVEGYEDAYARAAA